MFFIYKSIVANYTEIQKAWDDSSTNRRHRDRNDEDHDVIEKELWHTSLCDSENSFYDCELIDDLTLIIISSKMTLNWKEDVERLTKENQNDKRANVYIVAHEIYDKNSNKMSNWKKSQIDIRAQISNELKTNEEFDSDASLVWNQKFNNYVLKAHIKEKYLRDRSQAKSFKFMIIITTLSYDEHVQISLLFKEYEWFFESKQNKSNQVNDISLVCSIITIIDETHLVRQKNVDHFALIKRIQQSCSYSVKIA